MGLLRGLALLLALSAAAKAVVLLQLAWHPLLQPAGGLDADAYVTLARNLVAGVATGHEPFFLSPLYVYFLAGVFALTGGSLVAARAAQAALGLAAIACVVLTTRRWWGPREGWVAGALLAAAGLVTFHEVLLLQASIDPFLTALALWLLTLLLQEGPRWGLPAGLSLGLLALNRPNALAWAGVAVALVAARGISRPPEEAPAKARGATRRPGRLAALAPAAWLLAGIVLAVAPVTLRNWIVSGDLVLISSHGGLNFYIGNNQAADGTYHAVPGITPSIAGQVVDARREAERAMGRSLKPSEVSGYFESLAWDWMRTHPADALRLAGRKVALAFNARDLSLNGSYAYYSRDEPTALGVLIVGPWLLLPLGLVGLLLPRSRAWRSGFAAWAAFVPAYGLSVAAFFVSTRYRLPLAVPLACGAGGTLVWLFDRARRRSWRSLIAGLAAVAAAAAVSNRDFGLDDGRSAERTDMIVYLVDSRQDDRAEGLLAKTEPGHPERGVLLYRVGQAYQQRGETARAIPLLERAIDAGGPRGEAERALAQALVASGRQALERGEPAAAEPQLARAVRLRPADAGALEAWGLSLGMLGRSAEAATALEAACRIDGASASARLNLAVLRAEEGRYDEARRLAREAIERDPGYQRARELLAAIDRAR